MYTKSYSRNAILTSTAPLWCCSFRCGWPKTCLRCWSRQLPHLEHVTCSASATYRDLILSPHLPSLWVVHCVLCRSRHSSRYHRTREACVCIGLVSDGPSTWTNPWTSHWRTVRYRNQMAMGVRLSFDHKSSCLPGDSLLHARNPSLVGWQRHDPCKPAVDPVPQKPQDEAVHRFQST
jgi:hypothetical protein